LPPPHVSPSKPAPIRVAPKPAMKSRKKARNVFYDDRGFLNETNTYNNLLHNIDGGVVLRKKKFNALPLDLYDPGFHYTFNESEHGE
jgi:hypothetical protein